MNSSDNPVRSGSNHFPVNDSLICRQMKLLVTVQTRIKLSAKTVARRLARRYSHLDDNARDSAPSHFLEYSYAKRRAYRLRQVSRTGTFEPRSIHEENRDKTLQRALNTAGICIAKFAQTSGLTARALNPPSLRR